MALNGLTLVLLAVAAPVWAIQVTGQQHAGMHATPPIKAPDLDSCVANPLQSNCTTFEYPVEAAALDLNKLCSAMHFMSACSVAKACNASGAGPLQPTAPGAAKISSQNPNICQPFNQVATVCKLDTGMGRMSGCNNINTMCVEGSKVPTCSAMSGLQDIPTSELVNSQVRSVCEEMTMDGCERCMPSWQAGRKWADCDLLDVYGLLCYQMPEMGQCSDWHAMCTADPTLIFCHGAGGSSGGGSSSSGGSTAGPVMKMYFFEEMPFYLLFKTWTPRNSSDLIGAWFAIFALGLVYELLQMLYGKSEAKFWARVNSGAGTSRHAALGADLEHGGPLADGAEENGVVGNGAGANSAACKACCSGSSTGTGAVDLVAAVKGGFNGPASQKGSRAPGSCFGSYFQYELIMMDIIRGVARFVLAGLAYLLMLAAMSYHVAIFFAVITGVGVGSMLFGRWRFSSGTPEGYSHCGCGSS